MKKFLAKMNVSQVVFLLLALILAFQTVYLTVNWEETWLFNNVLLVIVGYYYGKSTAESNDTLVEWDLDDDKVL